MYCPVCNHEDTKVLDTRIATDGASIRRRRECEKCEYRFSTNEEPELLDLRVVKRDGSLEAYLREKIQSALNGSPHGAHCTFRLAGHAARRRACLVSGSRRPSWRTVTRLPKTARPFPSSRA